MENNNYSGISNLAKIRSLKKKADELSLDYHENIEKLKFFDKDIEYIIKKVGSLDKKLEKLLVNHKPYYDKINKEKSKTPQKIKNK